MLSVLFQILPILLIVGFWFVLAEFALFYFIVRFRRRDGVAAAYITGERRQEKRWITVPHLLIIVCDVVILAFSFQVWSAIKQDLPPAEAHIRVIAHQWSWRFIHPGPDGQFGTDDDVETVDELRLKVDTLYHFHLEAADVILIAGSNTAFAHPIVYRRIEESKAKVIVIDPRATLTARSADLHLQIRPGTDVALFNAMLNHILARGLENRAFIAQRTKNFDVVAQAVAPYTPERAEAITGVPAALIREAAERYARGPNTTTLWAMGLTQHLTGHDMVTSLLNLILATGMIGRWGAAMMPVRGQNNVQGASDMGAIPFVYPDYQSVADPAIRQKFARVWGVPPERMSLKPGLKVTEMTQAGSPIRALYIMGENPIISDPDIAHAEAWFRQIEFLTVQDLFLTETARYADVVLPGASFAEKTGTFVNTERRIQLAHQAIHPPGQARSDWEIIVDLSNRLGLPTPFRSPESVMDEIRRVAPAWAGVSYARLEDLAGLQYPVPADDHPGTAFLFDDRFPTDDSKATFDPALYTDPAQLPDEQYPFVMGTGRQLYHWHTGTMTRRSAGLDAREPTAVVEIHPDDAAELGVSDGDLVRLTSRRNAVVISARISDRVARRQLFVPFHFREAAANLLTSPVLEPHAKMAALKVCAVRVEPVGVTASA